MYIIKFFPRTRFFPQPILIFLYIFDRYIMMLRQSLWIIGFFFFGMLIYYEFIILKYKIYTPILKKKRKFENVLSASFQEFMHV